MNKVLFKHTQYVKDPVVHVRDRWLTETPK